MIVVGGKYSEEPIPSKQARFLYPFKVYRPIAIGW
jgi:hypothetical protein